MLTVNIEDGSVKLTSVSGKHVAVAAEAPLQPGWVQNGVVLEIAGVGQVISMLMAANRIREKECVACVSGIHSVYRLVYVPKLNRSLLAEAARQEMERAIPVPLNSLYTSWSDIKISDREIAICMVGLPFDNVNSIMDVLKMAGLRVKYLELKPLAISRVIDERTAIMLNVQAHSFDVTLISNGIPELIRSLPFPGGMSDGDKTALIREEVDRTVSFYNSSHPSSPLDNQTPCILSGYYRASLSNMLGYAVKPAPVLLTYPEGQDENVFTANTGLALRTINRLLKVDINVMPRIAPSAVQAAPAGASRLPLVVMLICAAAVFGMYIINIMAEAETTRMQQVLDDKTAQFSSLQKAYLADAAEITAERDTYQKILDTVKNPLTYLATRRDLTNRDIGSAISVLPSTVYLDNIIVGSNSIELEGAAPSQDILLNYTYDLRNLGIYRLVLIKSMGNSSYTEVNFIITLSLQR